MSKILEKAFKPRTDDVREAPAKYLIQKLNEAGAKVIAYDPVAMETAKAYFETSFETAEDAISACKGADALLIATEWNEFRNPNFEEVKANLKNSIIFDGRNALNIEDVKRFNFEYYCIGRQATVERTKE